jgi:hypothetical protein
MTVKTIRVTQQDIDKGEQGATMTCPVALAVKRAFRSDVKVDRISIRFFDSNDVIPLPPKAVGFIACFDNELTVQPISFRVKV